MGRDESRVMQNHPEIPYHLGETKLEKHSTCSSNLPTGLVAGGDIRKLGVNGQVRTESETNQTKRRNGRKGGVG